MKTKYALTVFIALLGWACLGVDAAAAAESEGGVALAIVYDCSGSMKESVRDANGKRTPKYKIANRALEKIARQLQEFTAKASGDSPRKLQAGLFAFDGSGTREVVKFGPFNPDPIIAWARKFDRPGSGTPLGQAMETAVNTVLRSELPRKHVLIITDGANTVGPDPADVLPRLKQQAEQKQAGFSVHFVAFDVDARVFGQVKKLGATVMGAADEAQLNARLADILQRKILLEDEEPPANKN